MNKKIAALLAIAALCLMRAALTEKGFTADLQTALI